jgi:hypothetical protein
MTYDGDTNYIFSLNILPLEAHLLGQLEEEVSPLNGTNDPNDNNPKIVIAEGLNMDPHDRPIEGMNGGNLQNIPLLGFYHGEQKTSTKFPPKKEFIVQTKNQQDGMTFH